MLSNFHKRSVQEVLELLRNMLQEDDILAGSSVLEVDVTTDLLEVCPSTAYFQADRNFSSKHRIWLWEDPCVHC
jgi:hypothetical protein